MASVREPMTPERRAWLQAEMAKQEAIIQSKSVRQLDPERLY